MIRWWNAGRYERECARETELLRLMVPPENAIRAVTEAGLAIYVKLHVQFPMHVGVAYL